MFLIFINILRAEEEMRCVHQLFAFSEPPYILKVTADLIKEYFSSSRSVYISVLLCSVLLLASFTEAQCLFSAQLKHTALQACLCPDIYDGADYVLQAHAAALLLCHVRNQALHLFQQWYKR